MTQTDIDVCSQALDLIGVPPISSFEDNSVAATCGRLYEDTILDLLGQYSWGFARAMRALQQEAGAPAGLWKYTFTMPTDMVRPHNYAIYRTSDTNQRPFKDYEIQGNKVLTDNPTLFMVYARRPPENEWPPHFYRLAIYWMAAVLASPITEDAEKAAERAGIAWGTPSELMQGGYMRVAKQLDGQEQPTARIEDYTLIEARLGGGMPDLR